MSTKTRGPTIAQQLKQLGACADAVDWAISYGADGRCAWAECRRGDWMLWILGKLSGPPESDARKQLVLTACACARLSLPHTKDPRVLACIETAERWARGQATIVELREARAAAAAAAYAAAAAAYAAAAAAAAAYAAAAYAADADADAAYADADAAYAAAAYAADADADADAAAYARTGTLAACADLVRWDYPDPPIVAK
jgi:hypothetical protein